MWGTLCKDITGRFKETLLIIMVIQKTTNKQQHDANNNGRVEVEEIRTHYICHRLVHEHVKQQIVLSQFPYPSWTSIIINV